MGITSQLNRHYRILIRQGNYPVCYLCGKPVKRQEEVSSDHIIAKSCSGKTIPENLAPVHKICNSKKGNMTVSRWFDLRSLERC